MQEQLELLKSLQGIDQGLNESRRQRQKLEEERTVLVADEQRVLAMVETLGAELDKLRGEQRQLDQSLVIEQDNIKKAEGRLPAIKTQKEYVAVLKEIDTVKKVNKDIQDRIRAKELEIESIERDKTEKDGELATITARNAARCGEIDAVLADFDANLAARGGERDALLAQLPAQLRKRYLMLLEKRGGVAIVPARKGTCLGCNMQLPPQLFNSLYTNKEVQSCPLCHRILYLSHDE